MTCMGAPLFILFVIGCYSNVEGSNSGTAELKIIPKTTVVLLDEPVHIACLAIRFKGVKSLQIYKIDERRRKKVLIAKGEGTTITHNKDPERFLAFGNIDRSTGGYLNLTISPAAQEDSAKYNCEVVSDDGPSVTVSGNLKVDEDLHVDHFEVVVKHLIAKTQLLDQKITSLSQRFDPADMPAFSATIESTVYIEEGQVLVFPEVLMQRGSGYDNRTGVFTAKRAGLYVFHFGYRLDRTNGHAVISIQKNSADLASAQATDDGIYGHSSCSAVTELKAGDTVRVFVNWASLKSKLCHWATLTVFNGYMSKPL